MSIGQERVISVWVVSLIQAKIQEKEPEEEPMIIIGKKRVARVSEKDVVSYLMWIRLLNSYESSSFSFDSMRSEWGHV